METKETHDTDSPTHRATRATDRATEHPSDSCWCWRHLGIAPPPAPPLNHSDSEKIDLRHAMPCHSPLPCENGIGPTPNTAH
jgi:hypothetical protein